MSADESVNNAERLADYWVFGGIFRPVYLEAVTKEHIEHTAIDARADGSFAMSGWVLQNISWAWQLSATIVDAAGKQVATMSQEVKPNDSVVLLTTKVNNPQLWTAQTPNLYSVALTLRHGPDHIARTRERFGFRTIEIRKGDGIYINGVQVKMKGGQPPCILARNRGVAYRQPGH